MCEALVELRASMARYAGDFDAALLSGADAGVVMELTGSLEAMAAVVKALAGLRVAECGAWKDAGDRSAAHHLARRGGMSVGLASDALATARRLSGLSVLSGAARSGALSSAQVSAVALAAEADPSAESALVSLAGRSSLGELRDECARVRAAAEPDPEARRKSIHDERYLRGSTGPDGAWHLRMRDNPEVGAVIMAALAPIRDRLFAAARAAGRHEASEAYAADALAELAGGEEVEVGPAAAGPAPAPRRRGPSRAKIIARVDLLALLRGRPVKGEVCELAGFGPVAASAIRDLIDTADPFLAAVVTKGEAVVGVAHLGRRARAAQQSALEWLYPSCAVEGCGSMAFLENDHRVDWATSHVTVFDLLDRLCSHHHDLKTIENWALVEGGGKRAFVPPDDPRHPRRTSAHDPPRAA